MIDLPHEVSNLSMVQTCLRSEEQVLVNATQSLHIYINSSRSACRITDEGPSEACVFRAYVKSTDCLSAAYCSPIKLSNGAYECHLPVLGNRFEVLVVLESLANSSDFGSLDIAAAGAVVFNDTHQCVGVPVLHEESQTDNDPAVALPSPHGLAPCSYREANIQSPFLCSLLEKDSVVSKTKSRENRRKGGVSERHVFLCSHCLFTHRPSEASSFFS